MDQAKKYLSFCWVCGRAYWVRRKRAEPTCSVKCRVAKFRMKKERSTDKTKACSQCHRSTLRSQLYWVAKDQSLCSKCYFG